MTTTRLEDYTVAWICAIPDEYVVACELLDEEYGADRAPKLDILQDHNSYTFGRIYEHNIVIACLPKGRYGITSAALVAESIRWSFPCIRFGLMVGIAGGAPSSNHDIRLGDIVVSSPTPRHGGVLQYDFGKTIEDRDFVETGHLAAPPRILLNAIANLETRHKRKGHKVVDTIANIFERNPRLKARYSRPDTKSDVLFETLPDGREQLVTRKERTPDQDDPAIHYGLIASANQVLRDRNLRDTLAAKHDVLCFEMEAAGLMNDLAYLVIRGICDYADVYKNDDWQGYAAAVAAAYARELLESMHGVDVSSIQSAGVESKQYGISASPTRYSDGQRNISNHNLSQSTNYIFQGGTVHGGIHHYGGQHTPMMQRLEIDDATLQKTIHEADEIIRQYYMRIGCLVIERLSTDTLSLGQCYINLALRELSNNAYSMGDELSVSLSARLRLEASRADDNVALDTLFSQRRLPNGKIIKPRRIFIQGRAGVGKTTLSKKIVYEYFNQTLGHGLFDRVLWLPLRALANSQNSGNTYGWLELLQDVFPLSSQVEKWTELVIVLANQLSQPVFRSRTLFLLDGLDEVSGRWSEDDTVFKFLKTLISTVPNVILTSRPQSSSLNTRNFDLELDIVGFSAEQADTYIRHCVDDEQERSAMRSSVAERPLTVR